jgi:hypothetical protein
MRFNTAGEFFFSLWDEDAGETFFDVQFDKTININHTCPDGEKPTLIERGEVFNNFFFGNTVRISKLMIPQNFKTNSYTYAC